jgi:hypothetical protein
MKEKTARKQKPLFVEGVFWLNFRVLVGCAQNLENCAKKDENPKKVSFHAQNRQKSNPMRIRSVPCTETGQNEVSKQTTEEGQRGNPGLSLFENQKKILVQQSAGLLYKKECACQ